MSELKTILNIIPYSLFPTTSAGKKSILHFNNHLSNHIKVYAANVKYEQHPPVKFNLVELFSNSKLRYINILLPFRLKKIIKDTGADFILVEHPYMAWACIVLQMIIKIKWGIRSHNIEYARFKDFNKWWWPVLKKYELYVYKKTDAVFFITEDDKHTAEAQCTMKHSFVMPTGMVNNALPADNEACREQLRKIHNIPADHSILLYNGALDYKPNKDALDAILQYINPYLQQKDLKYKILVCGSGLPGSYKELSDYKDQNIIYCGFVNDISLYFKGADIFLNPVVGGGGIKTRLVEAIAYNTNAVSTKNGSIGFMGKTVEDKVMVVEDSNWPVFSEAVMLMSKTKPGNTTKEFYEYYYWDNIIERFIKQVNLVIND